MNSRDRVMLALSHKEPDKLPIDCGAMRSTGIAAKMYSDYRDYHGVTTGSVKVYDMVQQLAIPEQWYLDKNKIDVVDLARVFAEDDSEWHDFTLHDGTVVKYPNWVRVEKENGSYYLVNDIGEKLAEMPKGSFFYDQLIWPYMNCETDDFSDLPERMQKIMWCSIKDPLWRFAADPDFYTKVREKAKKLRESTDYVIMTGFGAQLFELGCFLYRNDEFMINLLLEQKRVEKLFDALTEMHIENIGKYVDAIKDYVDVIQVGDDLGTQTAPMIDPELYRKLVMPRAKKIYDVVKSKSDIKVFLHTCGAVYDFLPYVIEAGVDIINPVQTSATGMDPQRLKNEFGKDLTFWGGGLDTQKSMLFNTPEQIKDEVKRNSEILMKDGGFIFNQIHNMLPGIPPGNIDAMYEAANEMVY